MLTRRNEIMLAAAALLLATSGAHAQSVDLTSVNARFSYVIGVQFGAQAAQQVDQARIDLEIEAFLEGVEDVLRDGDFDLTAVEMQEAIDAVQNQQVEENEMASAENKNLGREFIAEYAKRSGTAMTDTGIAYEVLEAGAGPKPSMQDTVEVHYRGTLIDGTEFDSSYSRNSSVSFPLTGIIQGWQEVLQMMPTGSKWKVVIPAELAYGDAGSPPVIPPGATLVFEIELLSIQ